MIHTTRYSLALFIAATVVLSVPRLALSLEETSFGEQSPEQKNLPFRKSSFLWDHSVTKNTLFKDSELTWDPTYHQVFSLRPRWYFNDSLSLRVRQDLFIEITEPNVQGEQTLADDTYIDLVEAKLIKSIPSNLLLGGRLVLPVSKDSQWRERILGTGVQLGLAHTFERLLEGLTLETMGRYTRHWATSNVLNSESPYSCSVVSAGEVGTSTAKYCIGGESSVVDDLSLSLALDLGIARWLHLEFGVEWTWQQGAELAEGSVELTGVPDLKIGDESPSHWRNYTLTAIGLNFIPLKWLELAITWNTLSGRFNPDTTRRVPFYNPDSQISATIVLWFDQIYLSMSD
ncbi:MAG: hypothetical protein GY847_05405 [Proteobacteria bacterium]|nr:hypothetical protein [Pseudomonadota bacterium]